MNNLVFLTGAVSELEIESENRYRFEMSIFKGDVSDIVLCRCTARHYETVLQAQETDEALTISGMIKSYKEDGKSKAYVGVDDAMIALPFTDDENTATGEGCLCSNPKAYANRTIAYMRIPTYADKLAFVSIAAYGYEARKLAVLERDAHIRYKGYVTYDGINTQLVIEELKVEGEENENTQNRSTELQRDETIRHQSSADYVHQGHKPSWKNDSYRCRVRHSDRNDVRRQYGQQHPTYGRAWS